MRVKRQARWWHTGSLTAVVAIMLGGLLLGGGEWAGAQPRVKLKQAHTSVLFAAPIYIAKEKGYFAEEGLDVELVEVESGQLGATALVAGEVQLFDADPLMAVQLREQGKRMIFFYNLNNRMTMDFIMRNEVVKAKVQGEEVKVMALPKLEEMPDLMSALRASIAAATKESAQRPANGAAVSAGRSRR